MGQILRLHHKRMPTQSLSLMTHILGALFLWFPCASLSFAQDSPITTSGLKTSISDPIVVDGKTQFNITGGTRAGTNLFHSFGEFNVPTTDIANFLNDSGLDTSNILGRVTGGNPSSIFGTIQTTGFENANLFLMNPSGIVFGPAASLNVGGSVAFTTADYLRLTDNGGAVGVFHAQPALQNVLTSAPVAAFGFLRSSLAAIAVQESTLEMDPGTSITLAGGNLGFVYTNPDTGFTASAPNGVTMNGAKLTAQRGQVNIAGVATAGEILAGTLDQAPNITGQSFRRLGQITIDEKSLLDVSGRGGGTVLIRGGQFVLDNSTISANVTDSGVVKNGVESIGTGIDIILSQDATIQNVAAIETNVTGNATPGVTYGGVHMKAEHIKILGAPDVSLNTEAFTHIHSNVASESLGGNSGPITLEADSILVKNFSTTDIPIIGTNTEGTGNGGDIILKTSGSIELNHALLETDSFGPGKAGDIELTSTLRDILMRNASQVTSQNFDSGTIGHIKVTAPSGEISLRNFDSELQAIFTRDQGVGRVARHGGIQITARDLTIVDSQVQIDNFTPAQSGDLTVNIKNRINLSGDMSPATLLTITRGRAQSANLNISAHGILLTGDSTISTESRSSGPGGQLNISTDTLQLTSGAQIRSGSGRGVDPDSGTPVITSGSGGRVLIQGQAGPADSILIDGQGTVVRAGQETIRPSGIISDAQGAGPAGNIDVKATSVSLQNGGKISAETTGTSSKAIGGSIFLKATDHVTLTSGASITASSKGPADAGKIDINAGQQLDLVDNSSITTTTDSAQANGGNIDIRAVERVRLVDSRISTSVNGTEGSGGNIFIDPKVVVLQDSDVTARAIGGSGGNITFVTPLFLQDSASTVSATSQRGASGTVTIQSPTSNLSETVGQLASKTSPPQVLLQNRCVALAGGEQSTFILAGRDTLPSEPGGWLNSPVGMDHWTGEGTEDHASGLLVQREPPSGSPILAAFHDKSPSLSLRRLTPHEFLVRAFAAGTTGCPS